MEHAKILLQKEASKSNKSVAEGLCIDVNTVRLCVQKYLEGGTELALYDRKRKGSDDYKLTITVSYDEKPGIQAIANTLDDLRPTERNGEVLRDYEYKRLGTVSLLAGIDLLTGEAIPLVSDTHKSADFVRFLKILDLKYPAQDTIRIILDNHSVHTSKETKAFLSTMPEWRFEFIFTPKHGSWLNMIESFFGKITK